MDRALEHPSAIHPPHSADAGVEQEKLSILIKIFALTIVVPVGANLGGFFMSFNQMFLLIMMVPLGMKLLSGKLGWVWVDWAVIAFVGWQAVSLSVNNPDRVVVQIGSTGIELLGGYFMARAYIRTPEQFVSLVKFLGLIIIVLMPFALYESVIGRPLILDTLRGIGLRTENTNHNEARLGLRRAQVVFPHPILFGLYCTITFVLCFVALKHSVSKIWRWTLTCVAAAAGFLSLSSGALLAMLIQLFLIGWDVTFRRVKYRWIILLAVVVVAYLAVDISSNRSPIRLFMSYATFNAHNAFWRGIIFEWGIQNVWDNPIFGLGLRDWVRPAFMPSSSVDNMWLVLAMQNGIPGFLFVTSAYLWTIWRVARANLGDDLVLQSLRLAWVFCFIGLTFTLATVAIWKTLYCFVFFMLGTGIWMIYAKPRDRDAAAVKTPVTSARPQIRYTRFPIEADDTKANNDPNPSRR